jgi:hypothetical protein
MQKYAGITNQGLTQLSKKLPELRIVLFLAYSAGRIPEMVLEHTGKMLRIIEPQQFGCLADGVAAAEEHLSPLH